MVRLKPNPENFFSCPECLSKQTRVNDIRFESINVMADCTCQRCGFQFYQVFPVGHTVDHPLSIVKKNGKLHRKDRSQHWVITSVMKAHDESRKEPVKIERIVLEKYNSVIILNTLDSLYGHVLLKLYNALYHLDHDRDKGLIIIVPKLAKWLIPKGCAEVWVVDLKLDELNYSYDAIHEFISHELERFKEVYLSKAYSHPDVSTINLARLTGITPFNLEHFSRQKPTITFVLREDRWWFNSSLDYWFYRICRKMNVLSSGGQFLTIRQNQLIKRTINLIKRELNDVDFHIIGLGKTGGFDGYAIDDRHSTINSVIEEDWCRTYAKSHVVVGMHGSNMLLPTALAAGCVEILPEERYGNMVQDLSIRYNDRRQLFFYRLVDQFVQPKSVGDKAVAIIRDYEQFNQNMCLNTYPN